MRLVMILAVAVVCLSCGRSKKGMAMERAAMEYSDVEKPDTGALRPAEGEVVTPVFVHGRARNLIHKDLNQTVYVSFEAEKGERLSGYLSSKDSTANIRISQIVMPDGSMDGPFSRDISYKLPETGTYRLAIHENMMAGEPWEGEFKIELALK